MTTDDALFNHCFTWWSGIPPLIYNCGEEIVSSLLMIIICFTLGHRFVFHYMFGPTPLVLSWFVCILYFCLVRLAALFFLWHGDQVICHFVRCKCMKNRYGVLLQLGQLLFSLIRLPYCEGRGMVLSATFFSLDHLHHWYFFRSVSLSSTIAILKCSSWRICVLSTGLQTWAFIRTQKKQCSQAIFAAHLLVAYGFYQVTVADCPVSENSWLQCILLSQSQLHPLNSVSLEAVLCYVSHLLLWYCLFLTLYVVFLRPFGLLFLFMLVQDVWVLPNFMQNHLHAEIIWDSESTAPMIQ